MKLPPLRVTIALLLSSVFAASLSAEPVGSVSGQVLDAHSHAPLPGVEVRIAGAEYVTATDKQGEYQLNAIPAGEHTLRFSYLGYDSVTQPVTVSAGGIAVLNAQLGNEIVQLEAFKVEGVREGQARALNQQKSAGNIKNVVAADAIGNFPDKNIAESLQRVSGISTVSFRGEPLYVTIRGANPAWNSVTLDGMSLLAANGSHSDALGGDMRSVQLDVYSSAQVGSIEVVKAVTPDLDGDSVGGAVLLKGKSAFDFNRRVESVSVAGSYNDLAEESGYRAVVSYSDVFGANRDWGVSVSYSREKKKELEESNETNDWFLMTTTVGGKSISGFVPTTLLQTYIHDERDRESLSGSVEKKLGQEGKLFVRGFWNKFSENDERYGSRYMPGLTATGGNLDATQPVTVSADGTISQFTSTKATTRRQEQPQSFDNIATGISGGGSWQSADWGLEAVLSYSRASEDFYTRLGQWTSKSNANRVAFDYSDPTFWQWTQLSGTSFLDPAGLRINSSRYRNEYSKNEEYSAKLDANRTVVVAQTPVKFAAGWKSRWNTKYDSNDVANYGAMRTGTLDFNDSRLGGTVAPSPSFLNGRYDFGPFASLPGWVSFFDGNRAQLDPKTGLFVDAKAGLFVPNLSSTLNATLANDYETDENIHAGYVRADWSWGKLGVIAGARYELTDLNIDATKQDTSVANTNPARYQPYHRSLDYSNWMPGVHLRYAASDALVFRAAWTNTLARPSAPSMTPNLSVDPINLTISGGNPDLHAVKSRNFDVSAEYYLSSVGIASIGAFTKSIDGPIYESETPIDFDAGSGTQRFTYSTFLNAGRATLQGIELSYQQQLRFLPSPFDGLGFYLNYTLTNSDVDVPARPGESFTLFNQSKWLGNAAVFYQKYNVTARLAYTFRAPYLTTLLLPGTDTYFDSDHRLDFQIGYKFRDHWTLQFSANNLENSAERQYHGNASRQEFYGLTGRFFSLGLTWEL